MIDLTAQDEKLLLRAINHGEIVLFLGAGASATSLSASGYPILQGPQLAAKLADLSGLEYHNEPLPSVVAAVVGTRISRQQFEILLREEFRHCEPSHELKTLMTYCWAKLYTWNLDDTITNCRQSAQRMKPFNGMIDPVEPNDNIAYLQVVHLHGEAWKPEHGYIFSESEYNQAISKGHAWYRQAAADYIEKLPVFIGSKLNEPILSLELDRARPHGVEGLGLAFLVTPDDFTPIQLAEFEARGITVIKGYLSDFVGFLNKNVSPGGLSPTAVTANRGEAGRLLAKRGNVTPSDLTVAQHLRVVSDGSGNMPIQRISSDELPLTVRHFLEGKPPNWDVVISATLPALAQVKGLRDQLEECHQSEERLLIVYGQSASGKTTGLMQAIVQLANVHPDIPIYEVDGNVPVLRDVINLLTRLHPEQKPIVYFGEAFLFGDSFAEDLLSINAGRLLFVGDSRVNEWRNHIRRRLEGVNFRSFEFQRFDREDYDGLAQAILKYVPAPRFHKLSPQQRIQEFSKSKSQLLIAMKEVTQSKRFRDIITLEYEALVDDDCRVCFLICGLATLARSGVTRGMAKEAYDSLSKGRTFVSSLSELAGIVFEDRNGRLIARHEVYVRHILENVVSTDVLQDCIIAVLGSFTKYNVPVIRSVSRQDGILFRFMLNHNFLREMFKIKGERTRPKNIYSKFEVQFQRDGHFWLQYGQYLSSMKLYSEALPVLEKSIQAYPENDYAVHALADVQLRVASETPTWSNTVVELIGHAVSKLEELHENRIRLTDQYAIVTLSERHIEALVRHKRLDEAREAAKRYFLELGKEGESQQNEMMRNARTKLLHFLTHGDFQIHGAEGVGDQHRPKARRRQRRRPS